MILGLGVYLVMLSDMNVQESIDKISKIKDENKKTESLFRLWWDYLMEVSPEWASSMGRKEADDRWTDLSIEGIARRRENIKVFSGFANAINSKELSGQNQRSLEILKWKIDEEVRLDEFHPEYMPVTQMWGPHIEVAQTFNQLSIKDDADFKNYLKRLNGISVLIDQQIELMREGLKSGISLPLIVIKRVPEQIKNLIEDTSEANSLLAPLMAVLTQSDLSTKKGAVKILKTKVIPAFEKLNRFFEKEYLPQARKEISWESLPKGKAWYQNLVRTHTTLDFTAKDIHQIGLDEVKRIRSEMDKVFLQVGKKTTPKEFTATIRKLPQFKSLSEVELLKFYRDIAKRIDALLPEYFGKLPRLTYGVVPVPSEVAESMPSAYYEPGSAKVGRAGKFYTNVQYSGGVALAEAEALTLHEAVPGHHLQVSLAQEMETMPEFRKNIWFTAYGEGWALYSEKLGEEMGFYKDPYFMFGRLRMEMLRACRLVVDTGIHSMAWTRDQAMKFIEDNYGDAAEVEVDRYIVMPAQALGYKIGELKIVELRTKAEKKLKEQFDLRKFHDFVLAQAGVPLKMLEENFKDWLRNPN